MLLYLSRRTLDVEIAVDLTAEAFAQAWRGWARVRADSREEVRAWLFTIARRQLARYFRRGRVEHKALQRLGIQVPVVHEDDAGEVERAAGIAELREGLRAGLTQLSDKQRDALRLRIIDEMPYDKVATLLGVSEPTARARVSRGLRGLRDALERPKTTEEVRS